MAIPRVETPSTYSFTTWSPNDGKAILDEEDDEDDENNNWTPLQLAAANGNAPLVRDLLQSGADPNAPPTGWYGKTALQVASLNGHAEVVDALLCAGAAVDAPGGNNGGRVALTLAAGAGHLPVVDRLLKAGAELNTPPARYMGRTALQAAAEGGHLHVVTRLMALNGDVNAEPAHDYGRCALAAAAEGQHIDVVLYLLSHGADVNGAMSKYKGLSALQAAASTGSVKLVEIMLDAGADIDASGSHYGGCTALYAAAEGGHTDLVKVLLKAGADATLFRSSHKVRPNTSIDVEHIRTTTMQATCDVLSQLLHKLTVTCSASTESLFPRLIESPFLRLPPELRNSIYELVLQQPEPVVICRRGKVWPQSQQLESHQPHHAMSLTATCRLIRQECGPLFYNLNSFVMLSRKDVPWDDKLQLPELFVEQIGLFNRLALRSLIVDLGGYRENWSDLQTVVSRFRTIGNQQPQIQVLVCKMCFKPIWGNVRFELDLPARGMKQAIRDQLEKKWTRLTAVCDKDMDGCWMEAYCLWLSVEKMYQTWWPKEEGEGFTPWEKQARVA
ncbi:hypothetical protein LTR97_007178 [Elasticomyces elasticus]|uniref:2EXR domain-containing protein n=1 Tax=Elasticomyces elasticus TaxID=574655 RepID=A0AAN7W1Y1_9PEZI|nr:hypothetical protein LTR97_007178 [Elasticomyces elasticus]